MWFRRVEVGGGSEDECGEDEGGEEEVLSEAETILSLVSSPRTLQRADRLSYPLQNWIVGFGMLGLGFGVESTCSHSVGSDTTDSMLLSKVFV